MEAEEKQDDGFELTRDAIKSLLADMFVAGTETSFITLEWAMSELVRNPAAMERLKSEVRASAKATRGRELSLLRRDDLGRTRSIGRQIGTE
ncbi:unnamed protein product [Miscanthus lutarioriparius]|uniref:Cytochrome P450 n=1 Tax=Miscanthus lutarioriparius TaxID=422564 RepID=A0A811RY97_9POAL|nr:unnamed protein product [Miscanthus lutarioriparius]